MQHIVTIFKNIKETDTPFFRDVDVVLSRIKDGSSKELVKNIRQEDDKSKRNDLKKNFLQYVLAVSLLKGLMYPSKNTVV